MHADWLPRGDCCGEKNRKLKEAVTDKRAERVQRWLDSKKKGVGCHPGHPLCRAHWRSKDKGIRVGLDGGRKQCKHQDFEDLTPLCKAFIEAEALMSRELGADDLMGHWMHLLETKVEALADLQDEGGLTPAQLSCLAEAQQKLKSLDKTGNCKRWRARLQVICQVAVRVPDKVAPSCLSRPI